MAAVEIVEHNPACMKVQSEWNKEKLSASKRCHISMKDPELVRVRQNMKEQDRKSSDTFCKTCKTNRKDITQLHRGPYLLVLYQSIADFHVMCACRQNSK